MRTTSRHGWGLALALTAVVAGPVAAGEAAADAVLEWNEIAQTTVASVNPMMQSRSMAVAAGIHVRHDQTVGRELGRRVGEHVCRTALRPLGGGPPECER